MPGRFFLKKEDINHTQSPTKGCSYEHIALSPLFSEDFVSHDFCTLWLACIGNLLGSCLFFFQEYIGYIGHTDLSLNQFFSRRNRRPANLPAHHSVFFPIPGATSMGEDSATAEASWPNCGVIAVIGEVPGGTLDVMLEALTCYAVHLPGWFISGFSLVNNITALNQRVGAWSCLFFFLCGRWSFSISPFPFWFWN